MSESCFEHHRQAFPLSIVLVSVARHAWSASLACAQISGKIGQNKFLKVSFYPNYCYIIIFVLLLLVNTFSQPCLSFYSLLSSNNYVINYSSTIYLHSLITLKNVLIVAVVVVVVVVVVEQDG